MAERGCGKKGRQARTVLRYVLEGRRSNSWMTGRQAVEHVTKCEDCRGKIERAIVRNPERTVYEPTVEGTLESARRLVGIFGISSRR